MLSSQEDQPTFVWLTTISCVVWSRREYLTLSKLFISSKSSPCRKHPLGDPRDQTVTLSMSQNLKHSKIPWDPARTFPGPLRLPKKTSQSVTNNKHCLLHHHQNSLLILFHNPRCSFAAFKRAKKGAIALTSPSSLSSYMTTTKINIFVVSTFAIEHQHCIN